MTTSGQALGGKFVGETREQVLAEVASLAPSKLKLFERALSGSASASDCVKAFCLRCGGMSADVVTECTATECPHWEVRPYRKNGQGSAAGSQTASGSQSSDPKRELMLRQVAKDAPGKLGAFRRLYGGVRSPALSIKCKCLECVWPDEKAIGACTTTGCPDWHRRPYQPKAK